MSLFVVCISFDCSINLNLHAGLMSAYVFSKEIGRDSFGLFVFFPYLSSLMLKRVFDSSIIQALLKNKTFISNTRLKLAKHLAKAIQHPEAELFENYSLS